MKKEFKSEDGLRVWPCQNGFVGVAVSHDMTELSSKDVVKLITYLAKLLDYGVVDE